MSEHDYRDLAVVKSSLMKRLGELIQERESYKIGMLDSVHAFLSLLT